MLQMESAMERLRQDVAAQKDRLVRLHINRFQESEIYQKCVRAPPNRTIFDGESPPPYRSNSAGILALGGSSTCGEWSGTTASVGSYGGGGFVRCHSISTSNNPCERTAAAAALAKKDSAASLGSHRSSSGKGGRMLQHQCQKASSMAVQKGIAGHPTGHSVKVAAPGQHKMGALPYHCQPQAPPPPPQPPPASVTVPMASPSTTTAASSPVRMSPPPQPNSNRLGQVHPIPSALQQTQQCPRQYQPNPHPRGPLASTHSRINVSPQPSPTLTPTILVPTSHVHKASSFPVGRSRSDPSETVSNPSACPSRSHQLCEFSTSPKAQLGMGNSGASGSGGLLAGLRMVPCMGSDRGAPCLLGREVLERHSAQDVSSASAECSVPQTPKSTTTSLSRVCEANWEGSGGGNAAVIARDTENSWDSQVLSRSAPEVDVTAVCKEEGSSMTPVISSVTATDPPSPAPHEQSSSLSRVNNF
ncbi:hypothetical protein J437_LFUL009615 [Ladona fulva]|uniref:Uncharacterized protein n=1 Tax=Ladona fulva TaxID=123851 RepID=A0A8K0K9J0_LADFU|nr:hypothetical protein J437_LFUL009615 [Ladona fulva]